MGAKLSRVIATFRSSKTPDNHNRKEDRHPGGNSISPQPTSVYSKPAAPDTRFVKRPGGVRAQVQRRKSTPLLHPKRAHVSKRKVLEVNQYSRGRALVRKQSGKSIRASSKAKGSRSSSGSRRGNSADSRASSRPTIRDPLSSASATETAPAIPGVPDEELHHNSVTQVIRNRFNLFQIVTPVKPKELEQILATHPNRPFAESLVRGFRVGFWPGADTSRMDTSTPRDLDPPQGRPRKQEQIDFLCGQCNMEIYKGRYSPSFGTELLPGMVCTPIFTKPKPGPKKFRLINNHSAGRPSLNSLIPPESAYTRNDTIQHLAASLRSAINLRKRKPPHLFKSDVAEAFRLIPMHPRWQVRQVNRIDDKLYVDRNAVFGNRGSGRLFCLFFAAVIWSAVNVCRLENIFHYVDDCFSYDFEERLSLYAPYEREMPRKQVALLQLFDTLGIPHESKKQEFGKNLIIIGFYVSLDTLTISIAPEKLAESLQSLGDFIDVKRVGSRPIGEWQKVLGAANWCLSIAPKLKAGLLSSFAALSTMEQTQQTELAPSTEVIDDLKWFMKQLKICKPIRIMEDPAWGAKQADLVLRCDALEETVWFSCRSEKLTLFYKPKDATKDVDYNATLCVLFALEWAAKKKGHPRRLLIQTTSDTTFKLFKNLEPKHIHKSSLYYAIGLMIEYDMDVKVDLVTDEGRKKLAFRIPPKGPRPKHVRPFTGPGKKPKRLFAFGYPSLLT